MRNTVNELQLHFSPFGYLDLQAACAIGDAFELHEGELFEIIDDAWNGDLEKPVTISVTNCVKQKALLGYRLKKQNRVNTRFYWVLHQTETAWTITRYFESAHWVAV